MTPNGIDFVKSQLRSRIELMRDEKPGDQSLMAAAHEAIKYLETELVFLRTLAKEAESLVENIRNHGLHDNYESVAALTDQLHQFESR